MNSNHSTKYLIGCINVKFTQHQTKVTLILLDGISSNSCGRVGQLVDLVSHLGHGCVNLLLMLHECRFDDTVVDEF